MILTANNVETLLRGHFKFSNLGFALLVTSLRGKFMRDPSPAALEAYARDLNAYIESNKARLANDIGTLNAII